MIKHREWDYDNIGASIDRAKEHNATVRAYRDAMAECERLGKANDEACDRIAELEGALSAATQECSRVRKEAIDTIKALESRPVLTWDECEAKLESLYAARLHGGVVDEMFRSWLKSRLPAPTDSIRVPFSGDQIERMAKAARPWLREPTGWELDVTAELAAKMMQDIKAGIRDGMQYSKWDELGENYKEDFIKTFEKLLPSLASRIRPTFECAECETWKAKYLDASSHADDMHARNKAARAALEGE